MSDGVVRIGDGRFDLSMAEVCLPIDGVPTYHLRYGSHDLPLSGTPVVIELGGTAFVATVARAVQFGGDVQVHAAGGNGSLSPDLSVNVDGKGYISFPAYLPLEDLLEEIGVAATDETMATAEGFSVTRWQRLGGPAAHALSTLARAAGLTWRVLGDGRLHMAPETWPEYDGAALNVEDDCASLSLLRAGHLFDQCDLAPGMTIDGRRIVKVVYKLTSNTLRMTLQYAASGSSTLREAFAGAVSRSAAPLGYGGVYEARVASQHVNGTVDVITGLASVDGPDGVVAVPLRLGLARARQFLPEGHLVRLRFEGSALFPSGDPSRPYAESIEQDLSAERGIARMSDLARGKTTITTGSILGATSFMLTPWRDTGGILAPRPDLSITVTLGADTAPGSGVPNAQTFETDGPIVTASEEVFLV
jgi:hypothetical protein